MLKFGFPLGNTKGLGQKLVPKNHTGARFYSRDIASLLEKEVRLGSAIGPFNTSPFGSETYLSPLNSVPKKDSVERRLILDLSFPEGNAINDGIDKDKYLSISEKLALPSVDELADRIMKLKRPKVFKIDLSRAYRQFFLDPASINWVGYIFNGQLFFDTTLSMGSRSSARCCQMVSSAVVYIFTKWGYFAINYLDDLGSAEEEEIAEEAYHKLQEILHKFGLKEALNKSCPPSHIMIFLGIKVNTLNLTLSIPEEKWEEIITIAKSWLVKKTASLKDTQKLAGLLNFACRCVKSGRVYLSRILNFLRTLSKNGVKKVPISVKKDVQWWVDLAHLFNGVSLITEVDWTAPDALLSSDSCLTGGGAFFNGYFTHWEYPKEIVNLKLDINQLECLMVVLTIKLWGKYLTRKKLVLNCDNQVTCFAINSGASRNQVIQHCLRELHKWLVVYHCELKVQYLKGSDNRISDSLSRWHTHKSFRDSFTDLTKDFQLRETEVSREHWKFLFDE